jgi:hypothetical protein
LAFADPGGVANPAPVTAVQSGIFEGLNGNGSYGSNSIAPDASLQRVFFLLVSPTANATADLAVYDENTYLPLFNQPMDLSASEGTSGDFTIFDLIRWCQDGLAVLTNTGHIYLLRGPVVVPRLLGRSSAATLTASSEASLARGSGNTVLTLTGENFQPGVAVDWNGEYRTTTVVNPTHVTVAIPASDLDKAGTASLVAVNPGAETSHPLKITIK